jgi:hypothetical protein
MTVEVSTPESSQGAAARFHAVRSVMPFGVLGLSNLSSSGVSSVVQVLVMRSVQDFSQPSKY